MFPELTKCPIFNIKKSNSVEKVVDKDKIDTPKTQIHHHSLSWLDTGTPIGVQASGQYNIFILLKVKTVLVSV